MKYEGVDIKELWNRVIHYKFHIKYVFGFLIGTIIFLVWTLYELL